MGFCTLDFCVPQSWMYEHRASSSQGVVTIGKEITTEKFWENGVRITKKTESVDEDRWRWVKE